MNLGMFAYPFVEAIWGLPGLALCAMWDAPNAVVVFGLAKLFAADSRKRRRAEGGARRRWDLRRGVVG